MIKRGVDIVGIGARTPIGLNAFSTMAAVRAGVDGICEHPLLLNDADEPVCGVIDPFLNPAIVTPGRMVELVVSALDELFECLSQIKHKNIRTSMYLGLPENRPGWTNKDIATVKRSLDLREFSFSLPEISLLPNGHASGLIALQKGMSEISNGSIDLCIVGGVDSYFSRTTIDWLEKNKRLSGENCRSGFIPGEGAGFIALASDTLIDVNTLPSLGKVSSAHTVFEEKHRNSDFVNLGEALSEVIVLATEHLTLPSEVIDGVICDINGERFRSEEWAFAIQRTANFFTYSTEYPLLSAYLGDVGAASAPLFVIYSLVAGARGYAAGQRYIVWTGSDSGLRGAAVLELPTPLPKGIVI